ncbi:hypothetical protein MNBD_ALPHA01-805 [hydrothermal vent metagenome]|uniref:Uncharacterized protein n=1 Tax=hydrothermal vent metagenome TaxID=652676 RepID=A0A3B0S6U6_9ZZZZ
MFKAVLDANVLYPFLLRDILIRISQQELYKALWTDKIHSEWINALLGKRPDINRENLERTKELMNLAISDATIEGYENIVETLSLPDENDRHVLAAAIKANAEMVVTSNIKDFPQDILDQYDIEAIHPDDFILCQIDLNPGAVRASILSALSELRNPTISVADYLTNLEKTGLTKTVSRLKKMGIESSIMEELSLHKSNHLFH